MSERVLILEAAIEGKPQPQGSATAFVLWKERPGRNKWKWVPLRRRDGSIAVNVTSDNPALHEWRDKVAMLIKAHLAGSGARVDGELRPFPLAGVGLEVEMTSYFKRREADWGTGRNAHLLKEGAEARPVRGGHGGHPDVDKLLRALLDSLTGVVWEDDSQITDAHTRKRFAVPAADGDGVRVEIRIWVNATQRAEQLPPEECVRHVAAKAADGGLLGKIPES